ncbi:multidrug effflux MFS transporter [Plebeiibacterium sediminum]|uniref:Multidrug effflux MFS transporter n=1 Tax=Plebeiibacterium sediminum TaxID=2992112 RepID=A0AAE3M6W1_9BACT|nr:multidrug effflux MFS transporter [Plebeiobacterium sediminum]MCW3787884.1 multidrug effflux MFS transporter [Plebeiobacterium sediminum]
MIKHSYTLKNSSVILLGILGAFMGITSLSTDIYLPAMPQMEIDLRGDVELTITGFLIGFSIAQLIWGPISDRLGRLLPLTIGIVLFIIGCIGCAMSHNITEILFWRMVQAVGACTGPMLSRAMVRDMHNRTKAAEMLSTLMIIMALAPIIGPLLGGQILKISSWHTIFWLLTAFGVIMPAYIILLPETLPKEKRPNASISKAFANYKILLTHRRFMMYTLCVTFYYVGIYAFVTGSPHVYITYFGVKPQNYGWFFAVNTAGIMALSIINRKLVRKFSLKRLLRTSTTIAMLSGIALIIMVKMNIGGIMGIAVPIFFFFSMNGIVSASANAAALDDVPEMAGAASALIGSLQYGSGVLSSVLLAIFNDDTPWPMSWVIGLFGILSALMVIVQPAKIKQKLQTR